MRHAARLAAVAASLALAGLLADARAATPSIGVATAVAPDVRGTPPNDTQRVIMVGTQLIYNERLQTSSQGQTQILFADQSTLTVGPNSDVTIDNYVYDPNRGTGQMAVSITKGVFRFVGGRISETAGATIKTPTATMGIRGSVLLGDAAPLKLILLQVKDFFIQNDYGRLEYSRNGRIVSVPSPGSPPVDVGRVTAGDVVALQTALEGARGLDGKSLPVQVDRRLSNGDDLENKPSELERDVGNNANVVIYQDPWANGTTPPPPPIGAMSGRLVNPPTTPYASDVDGLAVSQGDLSSFTGAPPGSGNAGAEVTIGEAGIVGGRFMANTGAGSIDLPTGSGVFGFDGTGTVLGQAVSGYGFTAPGGDFVAYRYAPTGGGADGSSYLMAGIPTAAGGDIAATGRVLSYDPIALQDGGTAPLPFLPASLQSAYADGSYSPFLVIERNGGTVGQVGPAGASGGADTRSRTLFAMVDIQGEGPNQRSLFAGSAGALQLDDQGRLSVNQRLVGTARGAAGEGAALVYTPLGTMADAAGNQFFGPDLNYMTIWQNGQNLTSGHAGTDYGAGLIDPLGGTGSFGQQVYGHVSAFQQTGTADSGALADRASGTLYGYAAGTIDRSDGEGGLLPPAMLLPTNADPTPNGVVITRSTADNSLSATFRLRSDTPNVDDIALLQAEYGGSGPRGGTYIDDARFGANQSLERSGVVVLNPLIAQPASATLQGFMATAQLAGGADTLPGGVQPCTCEFLSWGWWSADMTLTMQDGSVRQDRVHLGTWVAGDLPAISEVPTVGEATYQGHIVGTVVTGGASYIAAGAFQDVYNFGTRTGAITITQFDGRNYTGGTSATVDNPRDFAGSVSSTDGIVGNLNGSFVKNGADAAGGVIGQATFSRWGDSPVPDYRASAIFAAGKVNGQ